MSTIGIGDIHGNFQALDDLLNRLAPQVRSEDTVVFLGDYIDRGPDSRRCIDRIISFQRSAKGQVIPLLGNHEQWLLRTYKDPTRHSWLLGMEAFETIRSYSCAAAERLTIEASRHALRLITDRVSLPYELFFEVVPREHIEFLQNLRIFCRTPDAVCVHGGLKPKGGRVEEQEWDDLIWGTDDFPDGYEDRDPVLYGHAGNPVTDNKEWPYPRIVGITYMIDTISRGVLTALKLPENEVLQSDRFL